MPDVGTGTLETTVIVAGVVFALFLVRAGGVAPFATLLALGHGVIAPSAASSLTPPRRVPRRNRRGRRSTAG